MNDIAKEIITVFKKCDKNFINKLSIQLIVYLRESASKSNKNVFLDMKRPLKDQEISEEAKDFISAMYYYFIANKEEKMDLVKKWNFNDL